MGKEAGATWRREFTPLASSLHRYTTPRQRLGLTLEGTILDHLWECLHDLDHVPRSFFRELERVFVKA